METKPPLYELPLVSRTQTFIKAQPFHKLGDFDRTDWRDNPDYPDYPAKRGDNEKSG
jgi:hypothetical protein